MTATISLDHDSVEVEPGGDATCVARVVNGGGDAEQFSLEVDGEPASWTIVQPRTLDLAPGAAGTATLTFRPPRSARLAVGPLSYALRAEPISQGSRTARVIGRLEVTAFRELIATLEPHTASGVRYTRHQLDIDNQGNVAATATVTAEAAPRTDEAGSRPGVRFHVVPPAVTVAPGGSVGAAVRVEFTSLSWWGAGRGHPFQLRVEGAGARPFAVQGTAIQRPLASWTILVALIVVISTIAIGSRMLNLGYDTAGVDATGPAGGPEATVVGDDIAGPPAPAAGDDGGEGAPGDTPTTTSTPPPRRFVFQSERDGDPEIYVANTEGGSATRVTESPGPDQEARLSPDGSQVAFVSERDGNREIYVVNVDGTDARRLTTNTAVDGGPVWSPDGKRLAFYTNRDTGNWEVYVMNADGTAAENLTNHEAVDTSPAWSRDGRSIAFVTARDGNGEIYMMNAAGGGPNRLTFDRGNDGFPTWSPDGKTIVFTGNREGNEELYAVPVEGGDTTRLTNDAAEDREPSWSPDGNIILFVSNRTGNFEVFAMNPDGTGPRNLTNNPAPEAGPSF